MTPFMKPGDDIACSIRVIPGPTMLLRPADKRLAGGRLLKTRYFMYTGDNSLGSCLLTMHTVAKVK